MCGYRRIATVSRSLVVIAAVVLLASACNPDGSPAERVAQGSEGAECTVGVVGDSLMVGADKLGGLVSQLEQRGCAVTSIDAREGRFTSEGAGVVESWAASGELPQILVVGLGTNDCSSVSFLPQMQRILRAAGPDRPVVWVNTFRKGCDGEINAAIRSEWIADYFSDDDHGNLWVVDFWSWIAANPDLQARDSVHLNAEGYRRHARRIADFIVGSQV